VQTVKTRLFSTTQTHARRNESGIHWVPHTPTLIMMIYPTSRAVSANTYNLWVPGVFEERHSRRIGVFQSPICSSAEPGSGGSMQYQNRFKAGIELVTMASPWRFPHVSLTMRIPFVTQMLSRTRGLSIHWRSTRCELLMTT